jgi:hypothetical protein
VIALLRALAWMRWRQARALLRGNDRRDPLEQVLGVSAAVVRSLQVGLLLFVAAWFGFVGAAAGWFAAAGTPRGAEKAVLLAGLAATAATAATLVLRLVAGPRIGHAATLQRLLLLPIHPRHLRALHVLSGLAEPWPLLALPAFLLLPAGLAIGGRPGAGAAMLAAGVGLAVVLLLLGALAADVAGLVLRNRRRAEAVGLALAFGLILPGALVPLLLPTGGSRQAKPDARALGGSVADGRSSAPEPPPVGSRQAPVLDPAAPPTMPPLPKAVPEPGPVEQAAVAVLWATPPGLYTDALQRVVRGGSPWLPAGLIALWCLPLSALARAAWQRLVSEPDSEGGARGGGRSTELTPLSFVPTPVSAVALVHLGLARRSLMGRLDVLATPLLCAAAVLAFGLVPASLPSPPPSLPVAFMIASGGVLLGLASIDNMLFNQFGVHGPGLGRYLVSPLSGREIVRGQALANAGQAVVACVPCALLPPLALGGGNPPLWYATWLGLLGTAALALGFGALLSALLCKAVDMGRLQADNPLPGLIAMVALPAMSAPPLFVAWMAGRTASAGFVALNALWLLLAVAIGAGLLEAGAVLFDRRRERLLLAAEGR